MEEETALQKRLVQLEKLRAQKVSKASPCHGAMNHRHLMLCGWQEQEELHSYRARVLSELEDEKRKLETHIEEIQRETVSSIQFM